MSHLTGALGSWYYDPAWLRERATAMLRLARGALDDQFYTNAMKLAAEYDSSADEIEAGRTAQVSVP